MKTIKNNENILATISSRHKNCVKTLGKGPHEFDSDKLKDSFLITPILMNGQTNQEPLEYYPCSVASPSISLLCTSIPIIFSSSPICQTTFKKNCATEKKLLHLENIAHNSCLEICVNFTMN